MATPELRFAEASDGIRIGYQRLGSGAPAVVVGVEAATSVYDSSVNENPVEDEPEA